MKKSKNYNMYLPDGSDFYNVEDMNYNTKVIDEELKSIFEKSQVHEEKMDEFYKQSTGYTDLKIAELIGGAPSTMDTLKEIADAMKENQDVVESLNVAIGNKANKNEFEAHRENANIHVTAEEKQIVGKIPETYQKKDTVDGADYFNLEPGVNYGISNIFIYFTGAAELGRRVITVVEINGTPGSFILEWYAGTGTVEVQYSNEVVEIPVICMYKNNKYCYNVLEVLKQRTGAEITYIMAQSGNTITAERIDAAYNVVGNLIKQIGTTPLGIGNGTLTGAIEELSEAHRQFAERYKTVPAGKASFSDIVGKIPVVNNDGAMEIGNHVDFHANTNENAVDFNCRLSSISGTVYSTNPVEVTTSSGKDQYLTVSVGRNYYFRNHEFDNSCCAFYGAHYTNKLGILTRPYLGMQSLPWASLYTVTSPIITSDKNKKHDISYLWDNKDGIGDKFEQFFLKLKAAIFRYNENTSNRLHMGGISQDVEAAMQELGIDSTEFAGFCKEARYTYMEFDENGMGLEDSKVAETDEDGNVLYDYSLRYEEFIFLCIHVVQKLWKKNSALEKRAGVLEKENAELKEKVGNIESALEEIKNKLDM